MLGEFEGSLFFNVANPNNFNEMGEFFRKSLEVIGPQVADADDTDFNALFWLRHWLA